MTMWGSNVDDIEDEGCLRSILYVYLFRSQLATMIGTINGVIASAFSLQCKVFHVSTNMFL
jgi:hypothetical protein